MGAEPVEDQSGERTSEVRTTQHSGVELNRVGSGRRDRLRACVEAHFDVVWRTLRRIGVPQQNIEDVAQEVFLVLDRRLDDIMPGKQRAFLVGTSVRVASLHFRSGRRRREQPAPSALEVADSSLLPDEALEQTRARALLEEIVTGMPWEFRSVFVLYELEELTVPEISEALGLPTGTVASRLRRGRELFRRALHRKIAWTGRSGQ